MANGPITSSPISDFLNEHFGKKKKKKKKKNPLIKRYDSKGRPIGTGGADRNRKIMDYVDRAQSGKKK